MSPDDVNITLENQEMQIEVLTVPDVIVLGSSNIGPQGPPGPPGQWVALTQGEYDALDPPDAETLYVIIA